MSALHPKYWQSRTSSARLSATSTQISSFDLATMSTLELLNCFFHSYRLPLKICSLYPKVLTGLTATSSRMICQSLPSQEGKLKIGKAATVILSVRCSGVGCAWRCSGTTWWCGDQVQRWESRENSSRDPHTSEIIDSEPLRVFACRYSLPEEAKVAAMATVIAPLLEQDATRERFRLHHEHATVPTHAISQTTCSGGGKLATDFTWIKRSDFCWLNCCSCHAGCIHIADRGSEYHQVVRLSSWWTHEPCC